MQKDRSYWIYQRENVSKPWAIHVAVNGDRKRKPYTLWSMQIYHEDIPNTHYASVYDYAITSAEEFISAIRSLLEVYDVKLVGGDEKQLTNSYINILQSF